MSRDDWMDEVEDKVFQEFGYEEYKKVAFEPWRWDELYFAGLTPDEAVLAGYGE